MAVRIRRRLAGNVENAPCVHRNPRLISFLVLFCVLIMSVCVRASCIMGNLTSGFSMPMDLIRRRRIICECTCMITRQATYAVHAMTTASFSLVEKFGEFVIRVSYKPLHACLAGYLRSPYPGILTTELQPAEAFRDQGQTPPSSFSPRRTNKRLCNPPSTPVSNKVRSLRALESSTLDERRP